MATGSAVSTGDLITAAKMNLKQETGVDLANLSINDTGTDQLAIVVNENLSADRTLNLIVNDADRTLNLTGNLTLAGAFITSGANSLTLTTTGATDVTLPTTGTLAILAANTFTAAQTFAGNVDTVLNISTSPIIDIGMDVFATGTIIDIAYDTAEVLTGVFVGLNIDMGTNVTTPGAAGTNITGIHVDVGPITMAAAFDGTIYGIHLEVDPTLTDENLTGILVTASGTFGTGTEIGVQVTGDGETINIVNDADLYISMAKSSAVDINFNAISPVIDIGADVFTTGTFIDVAFDTAEVLTSDLTGINLDFSANLTFIADGDVIGYRTIFAALTQSSTATTTLSAFTIPTAGALVQDTAAGTLNWRGLTVQMPTLTQTTGTVNVRGLSIEEGTVNSGTSIGIHVNAAVAIDLVTNGNRIDFDTDNDTSIRASADDVLTIELGGSDLIQILLDADSGAVAMGTIQASGSIEMAFSVTNAAIIPGTSGTIVAPYLASTGAAFTDAIGGNINGAFGFNRDTDTGPTDTLEARLNGAWVSTALTGQLFQRNLEYIGRKDVWINPLQVNPDGKTFDEGKCIVCGEVLEIGEQITMYGNARQRATGNLHAIFGHNHLERDGTIQRLTRAVEVLAQKLGLTADEAMRDVVPAGV